MSENYAAHISDYHVLAQNYSNIGFSPSEYVKLNYTVFRFKFGICILFIGDWYTVHHSLRLYGQNQHRMIHLYMDLARLTKIPVIGHIVRWTANVYAKFGHAGYYLSLAEAEQIVDAAENVSLGPCSCREEFNNCDHPVMSEIVLGKGGGEVYATRVKEFRHISREEAKNVLREAHAKHLTQSIMRCGDHFYALCNCCTCCCVPTRLRRDYGVGMALVRNVNVVQDFQRQQLD